MKRILLLLLLLLPTTYLSAQDIRANIGIFKAITDGESPIGIMPTVSVRKKLCKIEASVFGLRYKTKELDDYLNVRHRIISYQLMIGFRDDVLPIVSKSKKSKKHKLFLDCNIGIAVSAGNIEIEDRYQVQVDVQNYSMITPMVKWGVEYEFNRFYFGTSIRIFGIKSPNIGFSDPKTFIVPMLNGFCGLKL